MNVISLSGTIGNAELKTVGETKLLKFSLAVKKYDKNDRDATEWFNCNLWGKRAEALQQHLVKGTGIAITGEMQINYNSEKKQAYPQVHVNDVDIIRWAKTEQAPQPQKNEFEGFQAIDDSSDVPF